MKNLIVTSSIVTAITVLMLSSLALANGGLPIGGDFVPASGEQPIIKAKWELPDENPTKDWTQISPPLTYLGEKEVTYWIIATDPLGIGHLRDIAYVDVVHPDETPKYQVALPAQYTPSDCMANSTKVWTAIAAVKDAYNKGILKLNGYTIDEVTHELEKCSAMAYKGTSKLTYHQMCGEFDWVYPCCSKPFVNMSGSGFNNGYKVKAYVWNKYDIKSAILTNYFEYICTAKIALDFDSIKFGKVSTSSNKWVEGDDVFNTTTGPSTPACAFDAFSSDGYCRYPTVRNLGNIPVNIKLWFDDMGFGFTTNPDGTKAWNVEWDGRLSNNPGVTFNPEEWKTLPGTLGLCNTKQLGFSIHVIKPGGDTHAGTAYVEAEPVSFPWWT